MNAARGQLIALLDRPSRESFGMVPVVVRYETTLQILGFEGQGALPLSVEELADVRTHGRLRPIDSTDVEILPGYPNVCAGWLGADWLADAKNRGVGLDPTTYLGRARTLRAAGVDGSYWLASTREVYQELRRWIEWAARSAFARGGTNLDRMKAIGKLMRWTLPDEDETRAVLYFSSDPSRQRERLALFARQERDIGNETDEASLRTRLEQVSARYRRPLSEELGERLNPTELGGRAAPRFWPNQRAA